MALRRLRRREKNRRQRRGSSRAKMPDSPRLRAATARRRKDRFLPVFPSPRVRPLGRSIYGVSVLYNVVQRHLTAVSLTQLFPESAHSPCELDVLVGYRSARHSSHHQLAVWSDHPSALGRSGCVVCECMQQFYGRT